MNLVHSPERLAALERLITRERLSYYLEESESDLAGAIRLYELNSRLSAMLYVPVQGLEVLIRNAMNEQLCARFGADWQELDTIQLDYPQEDDVRRAIAAIDGDETNGKVVAELSLGFWAALLNSANDNEIWRKALYKAFPHRPKGVERKNVHGAINAVRRLRNRIAHHEKIIHRDLREDHDRIIQIAGWICPETRDWIAELSAFDPTIIPHEEDETLDLKAETEPAASEPKAYGPTRDGRERLGIRPSN